MVTIKSGGGISSNKVVQSRSGVKVEPVIHRGNVAGVGQIGLQHAFKPEPILQGKGYEPKSMPPTGVKGSYNSATSGPGSGRTVYPSGSQGATPAAREMPPGRDTLAEYGKDSPTARGRR
jgi:hypothetical protein